MSVKTVYLLNITLQNVLDVWFGSADFLFFNYTCVTELLVSRRQSRWNELTAKSVLGVSCVELSSVGQTADSPSVAESFGHAWSWFPAAWHCCREGSTTFAASLVLCWVQLRSPMQYLACCTSSSPSLSVGMALFTTSSISACPSSSNPDRLTTVVKLEGTWFSMKSTIVNRRNASELTKNIYVRSTKPSDRLLMLYILLVTGTSLDVMLIVAIMSALHTGYRPQPFFVALTLFGI